MIWYADASWLVAAFGRDDHTPRARAWLRKCVELPILVSRLTILETEIAWRACLKDGRMSAAEHQIARQQLKQGLLEGILAKRELRPHQWFPQAHRISDHAEIGTVCRSLDVLHVSAAKLLKATGFLTFDEAQSKLAEHEGLKVEP
jgi:predicted nucleic acid-binding protein